MLDNKVFDNTDLQRHYTYIVYYKKYLLFGIGYFWGALTAGFSEYTYMKRNISK